MLAAVRIDAAATTVAVSAAANKQELAIHVMH
jgi:hypothetical protein